MAKLIVILLVAKPIRIFIISNPMHLLFATKWVQLAVIIFAMNTEGLELDGLLAVSELMLLDLLLSPRPVGNSCMGRVCCTVLLLLVES